jgi:hypothetical protein
MGPGKYNRNYRQTSKDQISWNFGKIPFGSGDERFKTDYRAYFKPGPGMYYQTQSDGFNSNIMVEAVSMGGQNIKKLSPR